MAPRRTRARSTKRATPSSAARPRTFNDLIKPHAGPVRAIAKRLRRVVYATLPDAQEAIYGGSKVGLALYSLGKGARVLCGIQPGEGKCLLYVHNVTEKDSSELRLEGKGRSNRHVKLVSLEGGQEKAIRALLRLACERTA